MKKKQSIRILMWGVLGFLMLATSLTLAGRKVGERPLPWHIAWRACFGENAWWTAFEHVCREGKTKRDVHDQFGAPDFIMIDGRSYEPTEINPLENRAREIWAYQSPFASNSGPTVYFEDGIVIKPTP